jgi:hypothetical protein
MDLQNEECNDDRESRVAKILYAASLGEAAFGIFPNLAGMRRGVR